MADNLEATDTGHRAVRVWVAIGVTASLAVLMLAASHVSHGASHVSPASLPCKLSVQHPAVGVVAAVYVGEGAGIAGKVLCSPGRPSVASTASLILCAASWSAL